MMFKKSLLLLLAGFLGAVSLLPAQEPPVAEPGKAGDTPGQPSFWQASLSGGHYQVLLSKIVSVSRHKYLLDSALIVDEVTIDTEGGALARFYFISPLTDKAPGNTVQAVAGRAKEMADQATEKLAPGMKDMVIKKYPETTHAKTLEYRLLKEKDLTTLYTSVQNAWESGHGRHFREK
jgi:hypothetical protein